MTKSKATYANTNPNEITRTFTIHGEQWSGMAACKLIEAIARQAFHDDEDICFRFVDTDKAGNVLGSGLACYEYGNFTRNVMDK